MTKVFMLEKKERIDGYMMSVRVLFSKALDSEDDKYYAQTSIQNMKGTYHRTISTKWFKDKEDGNNYWKELLKQGYKRF
jgi:hypothetical protein